MIKLNFNGTRKTSIKRELADDTSRVGYVMTGTLSVSVAEAYALEHVPSIDNGRFIDTIEVNFVDKARGGVWSVEATYKGPSVLDKGDETDDPDNPSAAGEIGVTFEVTSGSQFLQQSRETISSYKASSGSTRTIEEFKGLLNVDQFGQSEGLEVSPRDMAEHAFSVTVRVLTTSINNAFVANLRRHTGVVNNAAYRGHDAGEVMFAGLQGSVRHVDEFTELDYEFLVRENETNVTLGEFVGVTKQGWDYWWVYSEIFQGVDGHNVKQPIFGYVERLFRQGNLAGTGVAA